MMFFIAPKFLFSCCCFFVFFFCFFLVFSFFLFFFFFCGGGGGWWFIEVGVVDGQILKGACERIFHSVAIFIK